MIRRLKHFSVREKLIFLLLFAILLPTIVLLVGQYFALSELRDKSRAAFENNLRQNFVEIGDKTETRLLEKAEAALREFPAAVFDSPNSADLERELRRILDQNADSESVFIIRSDRKTFSLAEDSRTNGFRKAKSLQNPGEAVKSLGDDDFVIPRIVAGQIHRQTPSENRN